MPTNEEVMRFVQEVLDKAKLQDFNLQMMKKGDSFVIAIKPDKSAQDLVEEC